MQILLRLVRYQIWALCATWPPLLLCLLALGLAWLGASALPAGSVLLATGAAILVFDAAARLRQAEMIRAEILCIGGLQGSALKVFRQARASWCSRRAALAAASAAGQGRTARELVEKWGYRPWHVFPDHAFSARSPFLRAGFWKSVLGLRQ
ncbi:hypothetical protein [Maricaulis sp.]|uniref:hypothetical protein n=1 Tax=Maricaulis sp. TaxID=1486257 RepID=UPI00262D5BD4|nr:hypothetical protein [Maricaulis sp.]